MSSLVQTFFDPVLGRISAMQAKFLIRLLYKLPGFTIPVSNCPVCGGKPDRIEFNTQYSPLDHCADCGHVYTRRNPGKSILRLMYRDIDYWKQDKEHQGITRIEYGPQWKGFIEARIGAMRKCGVITGSAMKFLEIGCSEGSLYHRRLRLSRLAPVRPPESSSAPRRRRALRRQLFTGRSAMSGTCMDHRRFELMRHDVTFPLYVEVDQIFNLACPAARALPARSGADDQDQRAWRDQHARAGQAGRRRILQASTSEVYGDPKCIRSRKSYWGNVNPIGIRACYDEGKRCAETLFFDYHRQHKLQIKVVRIFNTYGPRMHPNDGRVVSNFIVQALRGEDITIYGDGSQTRSFCYVDDLIDGMLRMMDSSAVTGPINLGNPGEFTMLELAEKVIGIVGGSSKLCFKPLPQDDPRQRQPDITLASNVAGLGHQR
jgi:UDP-glucuronate decarboxylase